MKDSSSPSAVLGITRYTGHQLPDALVLLNPSGFCAVLVTLRVRLVLPRERDYSRCNWCTVPMEHNWRFPYCSRPALAPTPCSGPERWKMQVGNTEYPAYQVISEGERDSVILPSMTQFIWHKQHTIDYHFMGLIY